MERSGMSVLLSVNLQEGSGAGVVREAQALPPSEVLAAAREASAGGPARHDKRGFA